MTTPLRLGIAGLGTVGIGVVRIVQRQKELLEARTGRQIEISAVSARTRNKDRGVRLGDYAWEDDPVALAVRDDVDVFVELMGGSDGPGDPSNDDDGGGSTGTDDDGGTGPGPGPGPGPVDDGDLGLPGGVGGADQGGCGCSISSGEGQSATLGLIFLILLGVALIRSRKR